MNLSFNIACRKGHKECVAVCDIISIPNCDSTSCCSHDCDIGKEIGEEHSHPFSDNAPSKHLPNVHKSRTCIVFVKYMKLTIL